MALDSKTETSKLPAFHVTNEPGYTEAELRPLVAKWKPLLGEDLSPRLVTAMVLLLENFARIYARREMALPEATYLWSWIRRAFVATAAHRLFRVQVARAPVVVVTHRDESMPLAVTPRALRMRLPTPEMLQDLHALHGIDAETEMLIAVGSQLVLEIERYQINEVMQAAPEIVGSRHDTPAALLRQVVPSFRAQRPGEVSPEASFFAVMSPDQLSRLDVEGSGFVRLKQGMELTLAVAGTLECEGATVEVYEDPFFPPDYILAGWRNGPDDAGAIWAPYMLLYRPDAAKPEGLATRDAFKVVEPNFFAKIIAPRL